MIIIISSLQVGKLRHGAHKWLGPSHTPSKRQAGIWTQAVRSHRRYCPALPWVRHDRDTRQQEMASAWGGQGRLQRGAGAQEG